MTNNQKMLFMGAVGIVACAALIVAIVALVRVSSLATSSAGGQGFQTASIPNATTSAAEVQAITGQAEGNNFHPLVTGQGSVVGVTTSTPSSGAGATKTITIGAASTTQTGQ